MYILRTLGLNHDKFKYMKNIKRFRDSAAVLPSTCASRMFVWPGD